MKTEGTPRSLEVTQLKPPGRPGIPWRCVLEDGTRLLVTQREVADFALYVGRELSLEEAQRLDHTAETSRLRDRAMSILAGRPHSTGELVDKLKARDGSEEMAWEVAQWAEDLGLLNDEQYAKTLVRHYSAKGYGYYRIKSELYRRKVPRAYWEDALEEVEDPDEAVDRYLERHLDSDDRKEIKRVSDALARRGFSWRDIARGVERWRQMDDEE